MKSGDYELIAEAKKAALGVLLHNEKGPFHGLPRTAGWGYPEPYTRDLMFNIFGIGVTGNQVLLNSFGKVLESLAANQSPHGHIPSLVHDKDNRGASDTTPLFLLATAIYREVSGQSGFLKESIEKALLWMEYQSPSDRYLVAQQPTSDWRDEQWVLGFGLFVNTLVYSYLRKLGQDDRADKVYHEMHQFTISGGVMHRHVHEGLVVKKKPYYALWSYKVHSSERFDLLGNSLAILSGIATPTRAQKMVSWIERECEGMRKKGDLGVDLPPNFFPFIHPEDRDWHPRYAQFNNPGQYHNGGIWPFTVGLYIAALVAAKKQKLAQKKLLSLTQSIKIGRNEKLNFGFNEWLDPKTGKSMGNDWQSWSASLFLYAATCVEEERTPFFEEMRKHVK